MLINRLFGLIALTTLLSSIAVLTSQAQSPVQIAYTFPANAPGAWAPAGRMVDANNLELYGVTSRGGNSDLGTIYRVWNNGQFFTTLHSFNFTNGANPFGGLVKGLDGSLYGTATGGGTSSNGTVFKLTPGPGSGTFTSLFSFNGTNGRRPTSPLLQLVDGSFYGTTELGGSNALGTVFRFTTNGGVTSLFSFNGTNGAQPRAGLALGPDGFLYGATPYGGISFAGPNTGRGTLFKISTNGTFTPLLQFNDTNGATPRGELVFDRNGRLHGVTMMGGALARGTIFQADTNGALTTLIHFNGTNGSFPYGGLVCTRDGNFFGSTAYTFISGQTTDYGTLFRLQPNGEFTTLLRFDGTNGIHPFPEIIQGSNGTLYGVVGDLTGVHTLNGGTLFRLGESPTIKSISGNNFEVTLHWSSWPGRMYRVDYKPSASGSNWTTAVNSLIGSPGDTTSRSIFSFGDTQRVYRVVLLP